ncbi:hypothetical protein Taro_035945 [Colocasia esculenta]|uniref:Uncharacterized protein n=1 Tax=Colocasia esculenta TaxID=4460 RepID=A0A843WES3_COLES|nr:hypothetical protein [Colocasia esculenta]
MAMTAATDSGEGSGFPPPRNPVEDIPTGVLEGLPWVDYAVEQAQLLKGTVDEAVGSAVQVARFRLCEVRSTSSAHLQQTLVSLQEALEGAEALYADFERTAFGQLKEGILIAASHPTASCGVAAGVGIFASRRARRYLVRNSLRFLVSKEVVMLPTFAMVVMTLPVNWAHLPENEMQWHELLIKGLKIILRELPQRETSEFRSKVSTFPSQVKPEKKALGRVITRIRNCGILT